MEANFSSSVSFSSPSETLYCVDASFFRPIIGCTSKVRDSGAYAEPQTVGNGSLLCASVLLHFFPQFRKPLLRVD